MTICQILRTLYRSATANDRDGEANLIRDAYIMAKKMNKRLEEYKTGVIVKEDNERVWNKELDMLIANSI